MNSVDVSVEDEEMYLILSKLIAGNSQKDVSTSKNIDTPKKIKGRVI